ncbi:hypothetical protein ACFQ0B_28995 [Nonomuraea thailandensis]
MLSTLKTSSRLAPTAISGHATAISRQRMYRSRYPSTGTRSTRSVQ